MRLLNWFSSYQRRRPYAAIILINLPVGLGMALLTCWNSTWTLDAILNTWAAFMALALILTGIIRVVDG